MSLELTKIIDQFLMGELSKSDEILFRARMSNDLTLAKEVEMQQQIIEAVKRFSLKADVKLAGKKYKTAKNIKYATIGVLIIVLIATIALIVNSYLKSNKSFDSKNESLYGSIFKKIAPFQDAPMRIIDWNGKDSTIVTENGFLISVVENSFLKNGAPYQGKASILWQEAVTPLEIIKAGLETKAGNQLLETGGMFGLEALTPEGKRLEINPKVGIYIQKAMQNIDPDFKIFSGEVKKNGKIDWVNPVDPNTLPRLSKMKDLNFYPKAFEDTLNALKLSKTRKYRDSLYLSLGDEEIMSNRSELIEEPIDLPESKNKITDAFEALEQDFKVIERTTEALVTYPFIKPASVLAAWDSKFEKTNLSTRDFEKRLHVIHLYSSQKLFDLYVKNLDKSLFELDSMAVQMGFSAFQPFLTERIGKIDISNDHLANVMAFYEKNLTKLSKEAIDIQEKERLRQQKWDERTDSIKSDNRVSKNVRDSKNLTAEIDLNLKRNNANLYVASENLVLGKGIGVIISFSGAYNIDKYVFDATKNRKSMSRKDPNSKQQVTINYDELELSFDNSKKYRKVYTYLFPKELNSFERMDQVGDKFTYAPNRFIEYNLCLVAWSETGFDYYEKTKIQTSASNQKINLGKVKLEKINEKELNKKLEKLNKSRGIETEITSDFTFLVNERADYLEQKNRIEKKAFCRKMRQAAFGFSEEIIF